MSQTPDPQAGDKLHAAPLPPYLVTRYNGWRATSYLENQVWYRRLAEDGQNPRIMAIACCDSRIDVTGIFTAEAGEISFTAISPTSFRPTCRTETRTAPPPRWNMAWRCCGWHM